MTMSKLGLWLLACLMVTFSASCALAEGFTVISKDQLKGELGKPEVTVVDVRSSGDWNSSEWKVQGANREIPAEVGQWMSKYPKGQTIVLYCA